MIQEGESLHRNHETYRVPGLQRGLEALEAISDAGKPLGVSQISKRLGISRSSAFRLIYTLRHMGFLESATSSKEYTLGARVLSLGFNYLSSQSIIEIARRELEALSDVTNICAHLAIRDGRDVLYLDCARPSSGFLSNVTVGMRLPVHASPLGWLMLGELSYSQIGALYRDRPLAPLTRHTPTTFPDLLRRISKGISDGYVLGHGLVEASGSLIAAPIRGNGGSIIAAIDISGPNSDFEADRFETVLLAEVLNTAKRISLRLGYTDTV